MDNEPEPKGQELAVVRPLADDFLSEYNAPLRPELEISESPLQAIQVLREALAQGPDRTTKVSPEDRQKSRAATTGYSEVPEEFRVPMSPEERLALDVGEGQPLPPGEARLVQLLNEGVVPTEIIEEAHAESEEALRAIKAAGGTVSKTAMVKSVDQFKALDWMREANPPQEVPAPQGGMFDDDLARQLRDYTGCGFMDCKVALRESGGNFEKAIKLLYGKRQVRGGHTFLAPPPSSGDPDTDETT